MLTLKKVNKVIKERGIDAELVKDDGYFYFWGLSVEKCKSTSVYCHTLNQLTLEQWMVDLDIFVKEHNDK